jgi:hypothetical protein
VNNLEGFKPVKLDPIKNKLQLFSKNKTPFLEVGDITTYEQEEGGENVEPRSNFGKTKTL